MNTDPHTQKKDLNRKKQSHVPPDTMSRMMNNWLQNSESTAWRFQELLLIQEKQEEEKSTVLFPSVCIGFLFPFSSSSSSLASPLRCGEGAKMLRREVFPPALRLEPLRLRCVEELLKLPAAATVHAPLLFYAPRSPFLPGSLPPSRPPTPLFSLWCLLTLSLAVAQTFYLLKKMFSCFCVIRQREGFLMLQASMRRAQQRLPSSVILTFPNSAAAGTLHKDQVQTIFQIYLAKHCILWMHARKTRLSTYHLKVKIWVIGERRMNLTHLGRLFLCGVKCKQAFAPILKLGSQNLLSQGTSPMVL